MSLDQTSHKLIVIEMAEFKNDSFSCPICLDPLRDPVTIPCGHSYCMECIRVYWDQDDQNPVCCCPKCRETFCPRPPLKKNTVIAEMMEKFREAELNASLLSQVYLEPGNVECDFCTVEKHKAMKSCLQCLASYCETHLQPHYESPAFKRHKLVAASSQLQQIICSCHGNLLDIYCRNDQQCICYLCMMDEHKDHDTVSVDFVWTEKQEAARQTLRNSQLRLQEKENELLELKKAMESLKSSAKAAVEDSERVLTELICSIETKRSEVRDLIRAQEEAELSRGEKMLGRLEKEVADLKRGLAQLEQILNTEGQIQFLQSCQCLGDLQAPEDPPSFEAYPQVSFDNVVKSVTELKEQLEGTRQLEINGTPKGVNEIGIIHPPHPRTRVEFLQYGCWITLDPKTACSNLRLCDWNRMVIDTEEDQSYSYHPERFECYSNVMSREPLCGRCYWEVECSGPNLSLAVTYKGIKRKGGDIECRFGFNDKSWRLHCSPSRYYFRHNNDQIDIRAPGSSKVGVYLDHAAGILAFYSISDTMTLLHRVETKFTEPLYAGFGVAAKSCVRICDL